VVPAPKPKGLGKPIEEKMMTTETTATIGGMDLSNLTEDQLSVIRQLVVAAEGLFDKLVESNSCSALQEARLTKMANQCMTLESRVSQELKSRDAA
jgi:hypothetical protein